MLKSLRVRLQLWYALVLIICIGGFAVFVYLQESRSKWREVDGPLEGSAHHLEMMLRQMPRGPLADRPGPSGPGPGPGGGPGGPGPGPPGEGGPPDARPLRPSLRRDPARFLEDLDLSKMPHPPGGREDPLVYYFGIWNRQGELLKGSNDLPTRKSPDVSSTGPRIVYSPHAHEISLVTPDNMKILVGVNIDRTESELRRFLWQLVGIALLALLVGLVGGWLVSARVFRPIDAIARTASAISANNLTQRIDDRDVDREMSQLVSVLNAMFDRLQANFEQLTQFTADASHELRTPLTILQSHAELALSRQRSPEEYRDTLETCLSAGQRMAGLVESLLTLARADAGKLALRTEKVSLDAIARDCAKWVAPLAAERKITISTDITPAQVLGDAERLSQIVTNFLTNAIQYSADGGTVFVQVTHAEGKAKLAVHDRGCGISAADLPHVFDRFYRVDKARARNSGGSGLGLAICKCIVEAHGGGISAESQPQRGSTFWITLPAADSTTDQQHS